MSQLKHYKSEPTIYMSEQTKKCSQCLAEIPKKARKCSHCGSVVPTSIGAGLVAILIGSVFVVFILVGFDNDPSPTTPAYNPPPTPVSSQRLESASTTIYRVNSPEFGEGAMREVNLWQSYENRKKVGALLRFAEVEITQRDEVNDYCMVKNDEVRGWTSCEWFEEVK